MEPIELETVKLRFDGVRQAISRSRFTLLVSIITSVAILVTVWNARMSPDSGLARQPYWSYDKSLQSQLGARPLDKPVSPVTDQIQQQVVSEWIKNQIVSVGLLGIRISVADFSVLGSLSLLIASLWLFFSLRTENLCIGNLLTHAFKFSNWDDRYYVYQGIANYVVFSDSGRGDKPIQTFRKVEPPDTFKVRFVRPAVRFLIYLSPITILVIVAADIYVFCRGLSYFVPSQVPLWKVLDKSDMFWLLTGDVFALVLAFGAFYICAQVLKFADANSQLLLEFRNHLIKSCPSTHQKPGGGPQLTIPAAA
jgi:hypothetical protein